MTTFCQFSVATKCHSCLAQINRGPAGSLHGRQVELYLLLPSCRCPSYSHSTKRQVTKAATKAETIKTAATTAAGGTKNLMGPRLTRCRKVRIGVLPRLLRLLQRERRRRRERLAAAPIIPSKIFILHQLCSSGPLSRICNSSNSTSSRTKV